MSDKNFYYFYGESVYVKNVVDLDDMNDFYIIGASILFISMGYSFNWFNEGYFLWTRVRPLLLDGRMGESA